MYDIKKTEHQLAEKAKKILEHQQALAALEEQKNKLKNKKPTVDKEELTYEESLELGKKINHHHRNMQNIEVQLQKASRELNALQMQAKKLLPVSEVKVKVSTESTPHQTYCIQHIKGNGHSQSEYFNIEKLEDEL